MKVKLLVCLLVASATMSLHGVSVINKSSNTCYLSNFRYISPENLPISTFFETEFDNGVVISIDEEIEIAGVNSFYYWTQPTASGCWMPISNVVDSMIITIFDEERNEWGYLSKVPYEITSKESVD